MPIQFLLKEVYYIQTLILGYATILFGDDRKKLGKLFKNFLSRRFLPLRDFCVF